MLPPVLAKKVSSARWVILLFSFVIFTVIALLSRVKLQVDLGFNVHIFAKINAIINTMVTILLVAGLIAVKLKKYLLHKRIMLTALVLSLIFLISYVCHHLLAGDTRFGDLNHDGFVTDNELLVMDSGLRKFYFFILMTHIPLAAIVMPFVLFTAYRALIAEFPRHKKLARITWPIWIYVSITGVLAYMLISPYY